ncbi:MAG: hypothetical protein JXB23_03100 [Candidatus Aminicenantes bacterium]|nr:hypothetical protein [Candidatus Aminicenantes bacterium]
MSLENILKKIIEDARAEAAAVIEECKAKAEEIQQKVREDASAQAEFLLQEEERKGTLEASRIVTQARLQKRLDVLASKKELIDEVLTRAFQKSRLAETSMKRKLILKDGEREEIFDEKKMMDELRPQMEKFISEVLGL